MLDLVATAQFRKDLKRIRKRGYDLSKLDNVLQTLLQEKILPAKHRDHALTGDCIGFRECHVEPDWLLVYTADKGQLILTASRTGPIPTYFDGFYQPSFFLRSHRETKAFRPR